MRRCPLRGARRCAQNDTIEIPGTGGIGVASDGYCAANPSPPPFCSTELKTDVVVRNVIAHGARADLATGAQSAASAATIDVDHSNSTTAPIRAPHLAHRRRP